MQMEVLVRVAMIQRQSRGGKGLELRADLGAQLTARPRAARDLCAQRRHVGSKKAVGANQPRDLRGRQRRAALHQHDMQSDSKLPHAARTPYCIGGRSSRYHEAGCRQNSAGMRRLDRFIDLVRCAEIIRGHDQALHAASLTTGSTDPSRATSKLSSRH